MADPPRHFAVLMAADDAKEDLLLVPSSTHRGRGLVLLVYTQRTLVRYESGELSPADRSRLTEHLAYRTWRFTAQELSYSQLERCLDDWRQVHHVATTLRERLLAQTVQA